MADAPVQSKGITTYPRRSSTDSATTKYTWKPRPFRSSMGTMLGVILDMPIVLDGFKEKFNKGRAGSRFQKAKWRYRPKSVIQD